MPGLFLYYYPNGQSLSANQPREELETGKERAKTPPPRSQWLGRLAGVKARFKEGRTVALSDTLAIVGEAALNWLRRNGLFLGRRCDLEVFGLQRAPTALCVGY